MAVRYITNSKYNSHTTPIFKKLKLLKVDDIYKLSCIKCFYKYKHGLIPVYFKEMFSTEDDLTDRPKRVRRIPQRFIGSESETTQTNAIHISHTNTMYCRLCIRHIIPKLIQENVLPHNVLPKIESHSLHGFINFAKLHIINHYQADCFTRNCYICMININFNFIMLILLCYYIYYSIITKCKLLDFRHNKCMILHLLLDSIPLLIIIINT